MLALDPNETCEIVLALDRGKTDPPTFLVRYMTCRETRNYNEALKKAKAEKDDDKAFVLLCKAFEPVLVDWKNMQNPFTLAALADVLTHGEAWELALEIPLAVRISEGEKKKQFWLSQSSGAKDASTTPPADASIPPAPPAP